MAQIPFIVVNRAASMVDSVADESNNDSENVEIRALYQAETPAIIPSQIAYSADENAIGTEGDSSASEVEEMESAGEAETSIDVTADVSDYTSSDITVGAISEDSETGSVRREAITRKFNLARNMQDGNTSANDWTASLTDDDVFGTESNASSVEIESADEAEVGSDVAVYGSDYSRSDITAAISDESQPMDSDEAHSDDYTYTSMDGNADNDILDTVKDDEVGIIDEINAYDLEATHSFDEHTMRRMRQTIAT